MKKSSTIERKIIPRPVPASPVSGTMNGMMDYLAEHLSEGGASLRSGPGVQLLRESCDPSVPPVEGYHSPPSDPGNAVEKSGASAGNHRPRCSESCRPMRAPESVRLLPGVPPGKRGVSGGVAEKTERLRPGFLQNKNDFAKKSRIHTKNDRFVQIGMLDGFLKNVIP